MKRSLLIPLSLQASLAIAQMTTAEGAGSVRDLQSLAMPGIYLEAVNQKTGQHLPTETNNLGDFLLRALPLGEYAVQVQAPGFKLYKSENMSLTAGQAARLNITLEVGTATDSVSVSAGVRPVDTQTGALGTLVDTKRLDALPMQGRNVLSLAALTPGVTRASVTGSPSSSQQSINVDGNRASATNVMLDGASMYYAHRGAALVQP